MAALKFIPSKPLTVGTELEIQLIDPHGYDLIPRADLLLNSVKGSVYEKHLKPEITQSMIEINSSPHERIESLYEELLAIKNFLIQKAKQLDLRLAGGGTHPFQMWNDRRIYPEPKFNKAESRYGYLAKMFTVFGQHIHIGCAIEEDLHYLMYAICRYIPQLIALSASSPFCQGTDTKFDSCRANMVNSFPLSGIPPLTENWVAFCQYIETMQKINIIKTLDNFYWDIRPRPEWGTLEIRVFDVPLTIEKAVILTAYCQALAAYLLSEKPISLQAEERYQLYAYNRFQACRHGLKGVYIDSSALSPKKIYRDVIETYAHIKPYASELGSENYLSTLLEEVMNKQNDSAKLRNFLEQSSSFQQVVDFQSKSWHMSYHLYNKKN